MRRSNTPWRALPAAEIDWSDEHAPRSKSFEDVYFSGAGGLEESNYVFLQGNALSERLEQHPHAVFSIVETGFGTGLNFLQTWAQWRLQERPRPRLHYVSIEKHPLTGVDLAKAHANWPTLAPLSAQLRENYPAPLPGTHRLVLEDGELTLDLWWEDAADALAELAISGLKSVDAWYLDGFAPARNESMWDAALYPAMAAASRSGATFSTFTAAGNVRRGLEASGFEVRKVAGFGHKRECINGKLSACVPSPPPTDTPWDIQTNRLPTPQTALVIGAGLAGCTVAASLARRGISVTLLEQDQIASAGSGNNQGILYTRLSTHHSSLTDFALQSFWYSQAFYRQLFEAGRLIEGIDGALCGSFHQSDKHEEMAAIGERLEELPEIARVMDAAQASRRLGINQTSPGYWFPRSGWLRPGSVCKALIKHNLVALVEGTGDIQLQPKAPTGWEATVNGQVIASADCAVIATGTAAKCQMGLEWLPLQSIRGQTTELPTQPLFASLDAGFCHSGYISPAREESHCIGATFDLNDQDCSVRVEDHRRNLARLAEAVPDWKETLGSIAPEALKGRVAYRCATPDYLPLAGPVPNHQAFLESYGALRKNARGDIPVYGEYLDNLYLTTGHGSRGLTSAPLAAEVIASRVCGEAPPMSRELLRAIAPARFIIRQLKRGLV